MRDANHPTWRPGRLLLALALTLPLGAQEAEAQFRKQCMSCHTIGAGNKTGPDLKNVHLRRPKDWILTFVQTPGALFDKGDPAAMKLLAEFNNVKMPDLGITVAESEALLKLIEEYSLTGKVLGSAGITRAATPEDIRLGKAYFEGHKKLSKGGPACLACHSAAGAGPLGGGRLGPDLTLAPGKYGKGLASAIENPAFPSMQAAFSKASLTPEEAFQIAAYLGSVASQPPARKDAIFPILGVLGMAGGLVLGSHLGRKRFRGVRKNLEPKA